jgi:hypothetical protein
VFLVMLLSADNRFSFDSHRCAQQDSNLRHPA